MKAELPEEVKDRIRQAFPDISPSGDHDLLDEVIGLLRVTRGQRDSAEAEALSYRQRLCPTSTK